MNNYDSSPGLKFPHRPFNHRVNPPIKIDWQRYDELKAKGLTLREIAKEMNVNFNTLDGRLRRR